MKLILKDRFLRVGFDVLTWVDRMGLILVDGSLGRFNFEGLMIWDQCQLFVSIIEGWHREVDRYGKT